METPDVIKLNRESRESRRHATLRHSLLALAILGLVGCGERPVVGMPDVSEEEFIRTSDLLVAAQCELNRAARRPDPGFRFEQAVITMTLTVVANESTGGGLTLTIPIAGSSITLERLRRPIGSAIRRMDFQTIHDVNQSTDCPNETVRKTGNGVRYIEGGLGLSEWIDETDALLRNARTVPTEINYSLGFDIALSSSLNPIISLPSDNGISPDLSSERADDRRVAHRVAVTILLGKGSSASEAERIEAARAFLDRINRD